MRDARLDSTLIVPKLEPPPPRRLVVQVDDARPSRPSALLWLVGAVVLAIGFTHPIDRVVQMRQLRLSSSARVLLQSLGQ